MTNQNHYTKLAVEPIDMMQANFSKEELKGFIVGNLTKYAYRKKGQELSDAKKIQVYGRWLELLYDNTQVDEQRVLDKLIAQIPEGMYSGVVSEGRGGAYVAAQVAYALDVPLYIGKAWDDERLGNPLFVDDIEDTSEMARAVKDKGLDMAVLVQKKSSDGLAKYVGEVVDTEDYINFTFQSKEKRNESN